MEQKKIKCDYCYNGVPVYVMEKCITEIRHIKSNILKEKQSGEKAYWCKKCWDKYD